ncbi:MAG: ABC transporter ATP-binding protein [Candidatus Planktophila sp.]|nr:ABC transporter ATP-binding protein [Candidatus Planktophila sp.]
MAEIRLENVGHSYDDGATFALKPITLTWEDGNAIALLGPSGCGKTTLLNIISGLLTPSTGRVFFDGVDITDLDTAKRNVAQVFQFPVLYDTMTVRENLSFPLKNRNVAKDVISARIDEIAELLGLTKYLDIRPQKLRSDLQQLVSLGRGLVRRDVPAILFDEPLTVIDQNFKWTLRGRLKEMHNSTRHTLVYVTHDQTEALTFADKVVVLNQGEIVQTGTASDLFLAPQDEFVGFFIGSPGMNFMDASVSNGDVSIGSTLIGSADGDRPIANGDIRVGIRPEFLSLSSQGTGTDVKINRIEHRGGYKLIHADGPNGNVVAKLANDASFVAGEKAHLIFHPERTYLFRDSKLCGSVSTKGVKQ